MMRATLYANLLNIMNAGSGNDAFRLLMKHDFAVILLDVKMPGIDGFETAELIRKRTKSENTPIIFITAYNPDEINVAKGYMLGAIDYMFAPINPDILRSKVSVFVELSRLNRQADEAKQKTERINKELSVFNEKYNLLKNRNERLNLLFNSMPIVIFTLKPTEDFTVTFATQNTVEQLGYEADEFIKQPGLWMERIHNEDLGKVFASSKELFEKGSYTCEYRFRQKSGHNIWVQNVFKVVRDSNNQAVEIIGCLIDISAKKSTEEQLVSKAAELERSNAELQHFAYIASHDLQEPLRTISSYLQLIEKKDYYSSFDEKGKDYFKRVIRGAKRMQDMINDLLEYSRVVSNKDKFGPCDCNVVMTEALNNLGYLLKKMKLKLSVEICRLSAAARIRCCVYSRT